MQNGIDKFWKKCYFIDEKAWLCALKKEYRFC